MNDPKYDIVDGRLWHREGRYFVPDEEPVLVLRGKDPVAMCMIALYLESGPDESHVRSMRERERAFRAYQERYPERTRQGCHMHREGQ